MVVIAIHTLKSTISELFYNIFNIFFNRHIFVANLMLFSKVFLPQIVGKIVIFFLIINLLLIPEKEISKDIMKKNLSVKSGEYIGIGLKFLRQHTYTRELPKTR